MNWRNKYLQSLAYTSLVRPILEYGAACCMDLSQGTQT